MDVNEQNDINLNKLKSPLVEIEADLLDYPKGRTPSITEHGTIESTQFMKSLKIKVGARVMLVYNIDPSDSLPNGSLGNVSKIIFEKNNVKSVIVEFDNPEAGLEYIKTHRRFLEKHDIQLGVPMFKETFKLQLASRNKNSSRSVKIIQFFLKLAWASTSHKMQGITVHKGTNLIIHGIVPKPKKK